MTRHPYFDLPLVLVSGLGRSGTTVLRNCVAAHPEIQAANHESNYIGTLMRGANLGSEEEATMNSLPISARNFWNLHRQLILDFYWPRASKPAETTKALATYSYLEPRSCMGLERTFPKLSICFIVRNGIEVVSSYRSFKAFAHLSFEWVCQLWNDRYDMVQYCRDNKHATLIRYEWFLESPDKFEKALGECFSNAGIEFSSNCLRPLSRTFHPTKVEGETRSEFKDLAERKKRWKYWSDQERLAFKEICGETMGLLGYSIPF